MISYGFVVSAFSRPYITEFIVFVTCGGAAQKETLSSIALFVGFSQNHLAS